MSNDFFAFWRQLDRNTLPRVHPEDLPVFKNHDGWLTAFSTWDDFIKHQEWNAPDYDLKLQTSVIPLPYWGNLESASVVLLMLNPGFRPIDVWATTQCPGWADMLWQNLHQEYAPGELHFNFLDPQLAWHTGFAYWTSRFQSTLMQIQSRQQCSYHDALVWLGQRVACLQLVPYPSPSYALPKNISLALNSVKQVHVYVHEVLLPQALNGKKLLIAVRQKKVWDLPECSNILELEGGPVRSGRFEGEGQRKALWERLGI